MFALVDFEIAISGEGSVAVVAEERPGSTVKALMAPQVALQGEGVKALPAGITLVDVKVVVY